jgi:hypothetical protein
MKTYKKYKKKIFTTNELIVGFNFIDYNDNHLLLYYSENNMNHVDWIFFYDKKNKDIGLDNRIYNELNTCLPFEKFIKPLKYNYKYIQIQKSFNL